MTETSEKGKIIVIKEKNSSVYHLSQVRHHTEEEDRSFEKN